MMRLVKGQRHPLDSPDGLPKNVNDCLDKYKLYMPVEDKRPAAMVAPVPETKKPVEVFDTSTSIIARDRVSFNEYEMSKIRRKNQMPWVRDLKVDEVDGIENESNYDDFADF
jgi:hypothetical protein